MILGSYSPGIYFQVSSIFTGVVIILIYYINQYYHHNPPFPNSWISDIAANYPEFIFFRIATISGSVLMGLGWFTNHFYIKTIAKQHIINIYKQKPEIILFLGLIGSFFLMGSTANLDTGKRNSSWHTFCASKFFILTVLAQLLNTALFAKLYFSFRAVNKTLFYLKVFQAFLYFVQIYISLQYGIYQIYGLQVNAENQYRTVIGKILEFTMTYTVLFGFLIMSLDVHKFKYVYEIVSKQQIKQDNQNSVNLTINTQNNY